MLLILLQSQAGATTHDTSGALAGPGATVAGSAARVRVMNTTGVLAGQGSTVAGNAARTRAHDAAGVLVGQIGAVVGAATRFRAHDAAGVLSAPNAIIVGDALRSGSPAVHDTSGVLDGPGAIVAGAADHVSSEIPYERGDGWIEIRGKQRSFKKERDEREQLRRLIERAIDPVTETEAKVVTVKGEVAVVTESRAIALPVPPQFDAQAVAKMAVSVLESAGIEAKRVRDAENRRRAMLALEAERVENERRLRKRRRDEEILLLMG